MKLVGSHGSLLLLFIMKVMLSEFVIDSHKVYNTLIDLLALNSECCCGNPSAQQTLFDVFCPPLQSSLPKNAWVCMYPYVGVLFTSRQSQLGNS
jgi:hypothetical protein